jgi:hypothetical protein
LYTNFLEIASIFKTNCGVVQKSTDIQAKDPISISNRSSFPLCSMPREITNCSTGICQAVHFQVMGELNLTRTAFPMILGKNHQWG